MKHRVAMALAALVACAASAQMPKFDDILKGAGTLSGTPVTGTAVGASDEKTNAAGIKEALAVGTERAVKDLSRVNGYFGNEAVKILMPSKIQKVADVARMAGYQKQVDEFILSMNRAAEAAAPLAARYFGDAIRDMSLEDVRGILTGGDTAATEYFRHKTHDKLYVAFKPTCQEGRRGRRDACLQGHDGALRERADDGQAVAGSRRLRNQQVARRPVPHGGRRGKEDPHQSGCTHHRPVEVGIRKIGVAFARNAGGGTRVDVEEIRKAVHATIEAIAPGTDVQGIRPDAPAARADRARLRWTGSTWSWTCDQRLSIDIPESD